MAVMLAWETRMSEEEITAIVGFIRAWEPTAPEVAVPARGPGGSTGTDPWVNADSSTGITGREGPPWLRAGDGE